MIKILRYGEVPNSEVFSRAQPKMDVTGTVSQIISDVKANGDEALKRYTEKFDRVKPDSLAVSDEEIERRKATTTLRKKEGIKGALARYAALVSSADKGAVVNQFVD